MTINIDHLLAAGIVVRVGGADAWSAIRRLLGAGVRIGTEQQSAKSGGCRCEHLPHRDARAFGETP